MQDRTEIIRSPGALNYQLILFTLAFVPLAIISIFILIVPFTVFDRNVLLWLVIFSCIAIAFYAISILMISKTWHSTKYFLAKDCLIVASGFSSRREDVYRYESIKNISLQQSGTQKTRGYARLVLSADASPQPIILKDVVRPQEVLELLQNSIITTARSTSGN